VHRFGLGVRSGEFGSCCLPEPIAAQLLLAELGGCRRDLRRRAQPNLVGNMERIDERVCGFLARAERLRQRFRDLRQR
jgi:hypothetical protein